MTDSYTLNADHAAQINSRPVRLHSDVKDGDEFPAVVSRVDDWMEYRPEQQKDVKVGEIHHLHVFLPDHIENVKHYERDPNAPVPLGPAQPETQEEMRARIEREVRAEYEARAQAEAKVKAEYAAQQEADSQAGGGND